MIHHIWLLPLVQMMIRFYNNSKSNNNHMGGCLSQSQQKRNSPDAISYNPIKKILNDYSLSHLHSKWNKQQLQQFQSKNKLSFDKPINFSVFLSMFPKLKQLSKKIQNRYFKLLAYEGNQQISSKELMNSLTIIRKVSQNKDFAPLIFFVYTQGSKHDKMQEDQLILFEQENKGNAKNLLLLDSSDQQLIQNDQIRVDTMNSTQQKNTRNSKYSQKNKIKNKKETLNTQQIIVQVKESPSSSMKKLMKSPQKQSGIIQNQPSSTANSIKKRIRLDKFITLFENYNLKSYQLLFSWNIEEQQKVLAAQIQKQGLDNKSGDKVYLIQYQWFLQWKQYVFHKYAILLKENIQGYNTEMKQRKSVTGSGIRVHSIQEKPGIINNSLLIENKKGRFLIEYLVENTHYICVKQYIWNQLIAIYNGGPSIQRSYPTIYYHTVIKVYVDSNGIFKPNEIKRYDNTKQKPKVKQYASQFEAHYLCYYKYPGKTQWKILQSTDKNSKQLFNCPRTYLVFVPQNAEKNFKLLYNMYKVKQETVVDQRIKNYGSQINVYIQGVLTIAEVVQIIDKNVIMIEYISQNGNTKKKELKIDQQLKNINPQYLSSDEKINQLAGIINIGNSCYLNAVLQCLIRTPYFGGYLESQKFHEDQSQDLLLLKQISLMYKKSKQSNIESIDPKQFKKCFEKIYPYFEGNGQHDAQEFLNNFLSRILEEINSKKEEYGMRASNKKIQNKNQNNKNQKINRFFSGQTKAETYCLKCKNKGQKIEPFFTYSISLPEEKQMQFYYFYFRHHTNSKTMVPQKYGITLNRKTKTGEFQKAVSKQLNLPLEKIFFCTLFNYQILQRLDQHNSQRQVLYYLLFNAKLAIYQVNHKANPTYGTFKSKLLKETSIKIELKHRIYSSKMKQYKFIFMPTILEIDEKYTWKDVIFDIDQTIQKMNAKSLISPDKYSNHLYNKQTPLQLRNQSVRVPASQTIIKQQMNSMRHSHLNQVKKQKKDLDINESNKSMKSKYKIRVIKSDHIYENYCIFCKQQFHPIKSIKKPRLCKGQCGFDNDLVLIEQKEFRNIYDNIIISVDWEQISPEIQPSTNHPSFFTALQTSQKRKDNIQKLIHDNLINEQILELTCQKKKCLYPSAKRTQIIQVYPNILLLHLKRFTYKDNMLVKLTNNVIYPQLLVLRNQKDEKEQYELYGVVCHIGNGVGGHYISFVQVNAKWYRCDDHKVTYATPSQHIDPNAYLLFYKKIDFQPSLKALSIR